MTLVNENKINEEETKMNMEMKGERDRFCRNDASVQFL
jgi:hypothetical protein